MNKQLEQIQEKINKEQFELEKIKLERQAKENQIGKLKQQKVQLFAQGYHGDEFYKRQTVIDMEIEEIEAELKQIIKKQLKHEIELRQRLEPAYQELKQMRAEIIEKHDKMLEDIEAELFEEKLKLMKKIDELEQKRKAIQNEAREISNVARQIENKDKEPTMKAPTLQDMGAGYMAIGGTAPVVMTESDLRGVLGIHGARIPYAYVLFKEFGEIERDEKKAHDRLHELRAEK